jgi:hypothetical protein
MSKSTLAPAGMTPYGANIQFGNGFNSKGGLPLADETSGNVQPYHVVAPGSMTQVKQALTAEDPTMTPVPHAVGQNLHSETQYFQGGGGTPPKAQDPGQLQSVPKWYNNPWFENAHECTANAASSQAGHCSFQQAADRGVLIGTNTNQLSAFPSGQAFQEVHMPQYFNVSDSNHQNEAFNIVHSLRNANRQLRPDPKIPVNSAVACAPCNHSTTIGPFWDTGLPKGFTESTGVRQ